jgi:hypothetical protein
MAMALALAVDARGRATILAAFDRPDGTTELVCFGTKRHYRKAGDCPHTAAILATLTDEQRRRTVVVPFGGREEAALVARGES